MGSTPFVQEAVARLGTDYAIQGAVIPTLSTVTIGDSQRGVVALRVQAEGLWAYQLGEAKLQALSRLVAGKPLQEAQAILLYTRGIHQVTITSTDWWDEEGMLTLPADTNRIRIGVISWVGI